MHDDLFCQFPCINIYFWGTETVKNRSMENFRVFLGQSMNGKR